MGTIKQGILGGFSGRVGTVIGSSWKSVNYMRAMAISISNPKTEKQQLQRGKFLKAISFLKTITPFVRIGYKGYEWKQSAFNAAMSYVMKNAMASNGTVDYSKVLVTHGSLTAAMNATVNVEGDKVSYTWQDNSGTGDAKTMDTAMLLVYNKDKREAIYDMNAATRSDTKAELTLPSNWSGNALAVYLSFCNEDSKSVANSVCLKNDDADEGNDTPNPGGGSGSGGSGEDQNENPLG